MITAENNASFIFEKDGIETIAPQGSKVYVIVQDMPKGKVHAHGRILLPTINTLTEKEEDKEVGFIRAGEVDGAAMSDTNVLEKCHNAVKAVLLSKNESLTFINQF